MLRTVTGGALETHPSGEVTKGLHIENRPILARGHKLHALETVQSGSDYEECVHAQR